ASPGRSRRAATANWRSRTKPRSVPRKPRECGGLRAGFQSCRGESRHPAKLAEDYATGFLDSDRNDNHRDSITPKHGAHGCAIGASDFQRQRRKVVNAGSDVTEIK